MRRCAGLLGEKSVDQGLGYLDLVNFVLAFTGNAMAYADDKQTHGRSQYTNYPIETLVEKRGDCEDYAVLAAALLRELGVDTLLWIIELTDGKAHAAIGVRCGVEIPGLRRSLEFEGRRYYYCEATPTGGWRFGEMPAELAAKLKRNIPIPLD